MSKRDRYNMAQYCCSVACRVPEGLHPRVFSPSPGPHSHVRTDRSSPIPKDIRPANPKSAVTSGNKRSSFMAWNRRRVEKAVAEVAPRSGVKSVTAQRRSSPESTVSGNLSGSSWTPLTDGQKRAVPHTPHNALVKKPPATRLGSHGGRASEFGKVAPPASHQPPLQSRVSTKTPARLQEPSRSNSVRRLIPLAEVLKSRKEKKRLALQEARKEKVKTWANGWVPDNSKFDLSVILSTPDLSQDLVGLLSRQAADDKTCAVKVDAAESYKERMDAIRRLCSGSRQSSQCTENRISRDHAPREAWPGFFGTYDPSRTASRRGRRLQGLTELNEPKQDVILSAPPLCLDTSCPRTSITASSACSDSASTESYSTLVCRAMNTAMTDPIRFSSDEKDKLGIPKRRVDTGGPNSPDLEYVDKAGADGSMNRKYSLQQTNQLSGTNDSTLTALPPINRPSTHRQLSLSHSQSRLQQQQLANEEFKTARRKSESWDTHEEASQARAWLRQRKQRALGRHSTTTGAPRKRNGIK